MIIVVHARPEGRAYAARAGPGRIVTPDLKWFTPDLQVGRLSTRASAPQSTAPAAVLFPRRPDLQVGRLPTRASAPQSTAPAVVLCPRTPDLQVGRLPTRASAPQSTAPAAGRARWATSC